MQYNDSGDIVRRLFEVAYGSGDVEVLDEIVTEDFELHDLGVHRTYTLEELKDTIIEIRTAIPDWSAEVREQFGADDNQVVTRFMFSAPSRYRENPEEETGKSVQLSGIGVAHFTADRIDRMWMIWESLRAEFELAPEDLGLNWRWPPWG